MVLLGWAPPGKLGQAVTYRYFTDAVDGLLLGSSLVCAAEALNRGFG